MKYIALDDVLKLVRLTAMLEGKGRITEEDIERLPTIEVDEDDVSTHIEGRRLQPFTGNARYVGSEGLPPWIARWHKLTPGKTYQFANGTFVDDEGRRSTVELYQGTLPCIGFEVV